jgi:hypothetical protein
LPIRDRNKSSGLTNIKKEVKKWKKYLEYY